MILDYIIANNFKFTSNYSSIILILLILCNVLSICFICGIFSKIKQFIFNIVGINVNEKFLESLFNKKFTILFNGIDIKKYVYLNLDKIEQIKSDFHISDDCVVLGMVGSLFENKNQEFTIGLFNKYHKNNSNSKLIIVGNGSLRTYLENLTKELNIEENVIFIDIRSDIPELMHLFDVFLLPSKMEGLGIVAIEAQTCGILVIASTGVPKLIDMNLDLVEFKDFDIDPWLSLIIKNNVKRDASKLIDNRFDVSATVKELEKIYDIN